MGKLVKFLKKRHKLAVLGFFLQRKVKLHKNRERIARFIKAFSPHVVFNFSESKLPELKSEELRQRHQAALEKSGITVFNQPLLSDSEIDNIFYALREKNLFEPYSGKSGYDETSIPEDCSCSHYQRDDLVLIPEILKLANDPGMLAFAAHYLGATPTISTINLWWGTYREGEAKDNELFHRDIDDYDFIKFFVYLTDTDENDYNIVYVKNSLHSKEAHEKLRYSDQEIEDTFGKESIVHATGPKGTGFVSANFGVHKGMLPIEAGRKTALLQIQYSIRGIGLEDYNPICLSEETRSRVGEINSWVNRCLIKE